jgi:hypothetical protein
MAALAVPLLSLPAGADVVRLKNGSRLEGKVTEAGSRLVLETIEGGYLFLSPAAVARIDRGATPREEYVSRLYTLAADDARGHFELGLWCRRNGLYREASEVFRRILAADPDHVGARNELGYRRVDDTWIRGAWTELASAHFVVHHLTTEETAREARDILEATHAGFTRAFCPPLRYHAVFKIRVVLFNRRDEYLEHVQEVYPHLAGKVEDLDRFPRAFTESGTGRILAYRDADEPLPLLRMVLVHEAAHALLAMTRPPQAHAPAWFEEAFADTLASSTIDAGELKPGQGVTESPLYVGRMLQARDAVVRGDIIPLRDLLAKDAFDFGDRRVGLLYAESLSLLDGLIRRGLAARPEAFRDYLAAAQEGKGGIDTAERLFGGTIADLESRWRAALQAYRPPR